MKNIRGKKTFFLIPGFHMRANHSSFRWLIQFLKEKKIRVIPVPVKWKYSTLSANSRDFISFFNNHKGRENYIIGFSYGAVIALLTANILKPEMIFLCSLSPDFYEDRKHMKEQEKRYIGKKRFADTKTRSGREFAKNLKIPSWVLYGEKEGEQYPELKKRCEETARLAKNSTLIVVKHSPHQIDFPEYIVTLKKILLQI